MIAALESSILAAQVTSWPRAGVALLILLLILLIVAAALVNLRGRPAATALEPVDQIGPAPVVQEEEDRELQAHDV